MTDPTARSPHSVLAILLLTLVLAAPPGLAYVPALGGPSGTWGHAAAPDAASAGASAVASALPTWAHGTPAEAFQALQANITGPRTATLANHLAGAGGLDPSFLNATAAATPPVRKDPAASVRAFTAWTGNRTSLLRSRIPKSAIPTSVPLHPDASLLPAGVPHLQADAASTAYTIHPAIVIQGDAGFLSPSSGVVSGSGTAADPYIISGWNISIGPDTTGITINGTRAHVIIEDNIVQSVTGQPTSGLFSFSMTDVRNITIQHNVFLDASHFGHVFAPDTRRPSNITVEGNLFQDGYRTGYYPQDSATPDPRNSCLDPASTAVGDMPCTALMLFGRGVTFDDNAIVNAPSWLYAVESAQVERVNTSKAVPLSIPQGLVDSRILGNLFYLTGGAQMVGGNDTIANNLEMYAYFRFGLSTYLNGSAIYDDGFSLGQGDNLTLANNTHVWSGGGTITGGPLDTIHNATITGNTYHWAAGPVVAYARPATIADNSLLGGGIIVSASTQAQVIRNHGTSYTTGGILLRGAPHAFVANNVLQGPTDYKGNVYYQNTNLGIDVEGSDGWDTTGHPNGTVVENNTIQGFGMGLFAGTANNPYSQPNTYPTNITLANNLVENSTWGLVVWGAAHSVLRGNRIDHDRYAVDYEPVTLIGTTVHADESNTVDGVPMFIGTVPGNRTFDGAVQPYSYLAILKGDHIRILNQSMTDGGFRIMLFHVRDARIENSSFARNFNSIFSPLSNLTLANDTFELDHPYSVIETQGHLRAVNDRFASALAPQWWPWPMTITDLWLSYSTGSLVRNVTFENAYTAFEAGAVTNLTFSHNHILGGGLTVEIGGDTGTRIVGNTWVNSYYSLLNAQSVGALVANNTLRGVGLGLVTTSENGIVRDNVVDAAYYGIVKAGASGDYTVSGLVANNTILMHDMGWGVGMFLGDVPAGWRLDARNNTIADPDGWGIYAYDEHHCLDSGGMDITNNTIRWARWGVTLDCYDYPVEGGTPRDHINGNVFGGDRWAVALTTGINTYTNYTVDATHNYWGDATGPSGGTYTGHGDAVYTQYNNSVTATPWLASPPAMQANLPLSLTASPPGAPTGTAVTLHVASPGGASLSTALVTTADGKGALGFQNGTAVHTFTRPGDLHLYAVGRTPDGRSGLATLTLPVTDRAPTVSLRSKAVPVAGQPTRFVTSLNDADGYATRLAWTFGQGSTFHWTGATGIGTTPTGSSMATGTASNVQIAGLGGAPTIDPTLLAAVHDATPGDRVQVIVATRGPAAGPAAEAAARFGARIHSVWTIVNGFSAEVPAQNVGALVHQPWVQMATTEHAFHPAMVSGTNETHARAAWTTGFLGKGVTIAIVDSGITDSHPDLAGKILTGVDFSYDCASENTAPAHPCANANDSTGHGTLVAGVAAGTGALSDGAFAGVAPGANLVDLKIFDGSGLRNEEAYTPMMDALQWIQNNGSAYGVRVVYVGMVSPCFNSGCEQYNLILAQAANNLVAQGYVLVLPAGNTGEAPNSINAPGVAPDAITVGAVNDQGTATVADDSITMWSSRGGTLYPGKPDLVAPGVDITSTVVNRFGTPSYGSYEGTSMSSAMVAGMAALLLQKDPGLTPAQVKAALTSTAIKLPLDNGPTPNAIYGYGLADVQAALAAVPGASPLVHTVTFPEPGVYHTRVTATDNLGRTTVLDQPITVHGVDPSFAVSTQQPFEGTTVSFHDTSIAAPNANLTYAWTFGDGNASTATDPTHSFVKPGTYTVTETVTETNFGAYTATKTVHVLVNDHQAPNTTATTNVAFTEGWAPGPVTYALRATDHGGAGVATTYTMLDDGRPQAQAPNGSITVTGDGHHALSYWSVDASGNREATHTTFLGIDTKAPTVTRMSPQGTGGSGLTLFITGHLTVAVQASDSGSGVQQVTFQDDGVAFSQASGHGNGAYSATWPAPGAPAPSAGLHTLTTTVTDVVGHTTTVSTQVLVVPWPTR